MCSCIGRLIKNKVMSRRVEIGGFLLYGNSMVRNVNISVQNDFREVKLERVIKILDVLIEGASKRGFRFEVMVLRNLLKGKGDEVCSALDLPGQKTGGKEVMSAVRSFQEVLLCRGLIDERILVENGRILAGHMVEVATGLPDQFLEILGEEIDNWVQLNDSEMDIKERIPVIENYVM